MLYILAVILAVALDRWFKYWITANIVLGDRINFIPGVLRLTHVRNFGAAFGILENMRWLFVTLVLIFVAGAAFYMAKGKIKGRVCRWAMTAIIAGALGNLVDRIINPGGYVVDMFEPSFMNFAIFNIADIFVVLGGIFFCITYLYAEFKEERLNKERLKPDAED